MQKSSAHAGFTLIELSIVLVIIGLIVGGVLVGRDLIATASVRAQISQIEKYQQAVNTFKGKYNALPGDITPASATQFNFKVDAGRAGTASAGDGNGVITGSGLSGISAGPFTQGGETLFFWEDLSANANLIDGSFSAVSAPNGTPVSNPNGYYGGNNTDFQKYFPAAKIGRGGYVYMYEYNGNYYTDASGGQCYGGRGIDYFAVSAPTNLTSTFGQFINAGGTAGANSPTFTVAEAAALDKKIDDGLPISGNVIAQYLGGTGDGNYYCMTFSPAAATSSPTTCFEKTTYTYSVNQNNGAGVNCGLSFKFQ